VVMSHPDILRATQKVMSRTARRARSRSSISTGVGGPVRATLGPETLRLGSESRCCPTAFEAQTTRKASKQGL
jgi:hypothetical protein